MTDSFFPKVERVAYEKSPLIQVVAQFNFPPILRVESAPPADFQELIRADFPLFERQAVGIGMPNLPPEVMKLIGGAAGGAQYIFRSDDKANSVSLTRQSLTITTKKYVRWEAFRGVVTQALNTLIQIYKPSSFNRIGLRYSNAIDRVTLNTSDPWSKLISSNIVGELANPDIETGTVHSRRILQVDLPDAMGSFILQHGFSATDTPSAYAIDFDFFVSQRIEITNAGQVLESFHDRAGRAFRWAIGDKLHHLLEPRLCEASNSSDRNYGVG